MDLLERLLFWQKSKDSWQAIIHDKRSAKERGIYESPINGLSIKSCEQQIKMCEARIKSLHAQMMAQMPESDW